MNQAAGGDLLLYALGSKNIFSGFKNTTQNKTSKTQFREIGISCCNLSPAAIDLLYYMQYISTDKPVKQASNHIPVK